MKPKRLIFITGAEGSGTTLLRRLLAAPDCCASLGRDIAKLPAHPDARPLFAALEAASARLWSRTATLADHEAARRDWHGAPERLRLSPAYADITHLVLKRSSPFGVEGDRGCPDLWDAVDFGGETRLAVIYREPCAATYSAFRRGFDTDLRRLAVRCDEHLTRLAAQVQAIGPARVRIVSYKSLCAAPDATLAALAEFCGIPVDPIRRAAAAEGLMAGTDRRYAEELPPAESAWLEGFFDPRRRRQWAALASVG